MAAPCSFPISKAGAFEPKLDSMQAPASNEAGFLFVEEHVKPFGYCQYDVTL